METKVKSPEEVKELVLRVNEGIATEQEVGFALKQLQISLATTMLNEMSEIGKSLDALKDVRQRLIDRLETLVITDIDVMDIDTVMNLYKDIMKIQTEHLDFQRRVIQGKSIYDFNTLNDEEKLVVQLMKSFSSLDEKRRFMELVQSQLKKE